MRPVPTLVTSIVWSASLAQTSMAPRMTIKSVLSRETFAAFLAMSTLNRIHAADVEQVVKAQL